VSFSAASNTSWSKLNALYKENAATSYQVIQNAYANVALLSLPNSSDLIFLGSAPDYIYNPLLTVKECNTTLPHSPIPYTLFELAKVSLPAPGNSWMDWSHAWGTEMHLKRVLEKLNLEYPRDSAD